jgi:acetyl esterase/lipase
MFRTALAVWFALSFAVSVAAQPRPDTTIVYARVDSIDLKLDLYLPSVPAPLNDLDFSAARNARSWPLIIWFHGGGWRGGSRADPSPAMPFLDSGYAVASVSYRLSTQALWPAQLHDAKAAVRWLRARAPAYTLDTARFVAWGTSAGGHLAAMLGVTSPQDSLEGRVGEDSGVSAGVRAVVVYHGPSDFLEPHAKRGKKGSSIAELLGCTVAECRERARLASPVSYVTFDDASFFIVHGLADSTVPFSQAVRLESALRRAAVPVEIILLPKADHGGPGFVSEAMMARVRAFLNHALIR